MSLIGIARGEKIFLILPAPMQQGNAGAA